MRYTLLSLLVLALFFSCTEKENIYVNEHENQIIDNNTAPPYSGVTSLQIQNYINKAYIDLLGREPTEGELNAATNSFQSNGLDDNAREILLDDIINTSEYYSRFFDIYRQDYLNGVLDQQFEELIFTYEFLYNQYINMSDPLSQATAAQLALGIEKMEALKNASEDYEAGAIDVNEFMIRIIYNPVYDEINMGSENFVVAAFNDLYKRNPTEAELRNGVDMVDGGPAQLLLQDGTNKDDFVNIVTSNLEFYQGLTFDLYNILLARTPTSIEMDATTSALSQSKNYQQAQKKIMKTEEYVGF